MSLKEQIEKGVELLALCQKLQSEKDGVDRPDLHVIDKSKTLDKFAMDISATSNLLHSLYTLIPMMDSLSNLGRELEKDEKIKVDFGDDYSKLALDYLISQNGAAK